MTGENDQFELEPEDESKAPKTPRPLPKQRRYEVPVGEEDVDTRTVAERKGEQQPRGAVERIPNPPEWPGEALTFPARRPGPGFIVLGVMVLFLLDLAGTTDELRFPGWIVKLLLLIYFLRAQFHVIGTSAAGRDKPEGWSKALIFDKEDLRTYWRTLLMFGGVLLPGSILWAVFDKIGPGLVLLAVGSMYAAVIAMGAALGDPTLKWPWHALKWMTVRPLHCFVGSLGWWVLLGTEFAMSDLFGEGPVLVGFVSLALRGVCIYTLLVSARVIGVMGRAWTSSA